MTFKELATGLIYAELLRKEELKIPRQQLMESAVNQASQLSELLKDDEEVTECSAWNAWVQKSRNL